MEEKKQVMVSIPLDLDIHAMVKESARVDQRTMQAYLQRLIKADCDSKYEETA
jgi:hypothetical protein